MNWHWRRLVWPALVVVLLAGCGAWGSATDISFTSCNRSARRMATDRSTEGLECIALLGRSWLRFLTLIQSLWLTSVRLFPGS